MARLAAAVLVVLLFAANLCPAGDRDFDAVVREFETQFQTRRTHIPMLGLAKFVVRVARPEGVKQLDLAIFEDFHAPDGSDFDAIVRHAAGSRWQRIVAVRSRADRERTYVYARTAGKDWNLLVATLEENDATLVRVKVNPDQLARMLCEPEHMASSIGSRESD